MLSLILWLPLTLTRICLNDKIVFFHNSADLPPLYLEAKEVVDQFLGFTLWCKLPVCSHLQIPYSMHSPLHLIYDTLVFINAFFTNISAIQETGMMRQWSIICCYSTVSVAVENVGLSSLQYVCVNSPEGDLDTMFRLVKCLKSDIQAYFV